MKFSDELKIGRIRDYVGWTIRTAALTNPHKLWKNVFDNWVLKKNVGKVVDELQEQQEGDAVFVVYPSWKWEKAGAILSEGTRVTVEGVRGSINDLSRQGTVDARFSYHYRDLQHTHGDKKFFSPAEKKVIAYACGQVMGKNLITEFAVTTQNKLIFFRLEKIEEAAKLLLEKYG
ncbi:hypothetical protein A3J43_04145 [Candidatus Uhrbacteria bacterium RIFCSPHIGHO2_12_FULL_54_23]|uniref:Uncharacterized protein n=1 Tax=Candidatus Uhrbacteria bacterium RIFCSPHIGHO2_12_FULL_54_23 TaxID=1802397 RepID=A0A1F7UII5_9BACT|nr:MAG: hypothetical protein A3J43_04145 [Candidatus Uhrbacteria bacterium RIFCSPHIGHO2_12_FULL_54_23]